MAEIIGHIGRAQTLTAELSTPQTITGSLCGGAAHGIPTGGEPGQGLIKVSDADYDVKWMSILPEDTASGAVASFPDGADDLPMGVVVDIDPVQDLHGYDNPWPGGGGKNKINYLACVGLGPRNGTDSIQSNVTISSDTITVTGRGSYVNGGQILKGIGHPSITGAFTVSADVKCTANQIAFGVGAYEGGGVSDVDTSISVTPDTWTHISRTFTDKTYAEIGIFIQPKAYADVLEIKNIQLEAGSAATAYAPYSNVCPISGRTGAKIYHSGADTSNPTEYEIPFSTEVYGGKLNVETGELVVDRALVDMGTRTWTYIQPSTAIPYGTFYNTIRNKKFGQTNLICSTYPVKQSFRYDYVIQGNSGANTVYVTDSTYNGDANALKTAVTGQTICYELATPITLTLDPVEIRSLLGDNNVWSNTGNTSVTYLADVQKYIDKKISAAVAAMS